MKPDRHGAVRRRHAVPATCSTLEGDALTAYRRAVQFVFQDPFSSPQSAHDGLRDPDRAAADPRYRHVATNALRAGKATLDMVGLDRRFVAALSAFVLRRAAPAHRHRAGARARAAVLLCDEPVSALDVSVQAQVLNLLKDLQNGARAVLPVRVAQPRGRRLHRRHDRRDVPRLHRRAGAAGDACSATRCTPTRRRFWPRCPTPISTGRSISTSCGRTASPIRRDGPSPFRLEPGRARPR